MSAEKVAWFLLHKQQQQQPKVLNTLEKGKLFKHKNPN